MIRQTIAVLTLTSLASLTLGCYTELVSLGLDEVAVDTPKRITGVVPKTGEAVTFDSKGGNYDPAHRRISGENTDGVRLVTSLKELDSVMVVDLAEDSPLPFSVNAQDLHDYLSPRKSGEIVSVVTRQSVVYKFWHGARVDPHNKMVSGLSTSGANLRIPFDSVAFLRAMQVDKHKSWVIASTYVASHLVTLLILLSVW